MYYSNSNIKGLLDSWYVTNIEGKGYSNKVATGNYFCEQAKVARDSNSITNSGVSMTLYSSYTPNFKCSTDKNGYGIVNSNIGLITYDEVVHAGGYPGNTNNNYYLYTITLGYTMSPAGTTKNSTTLEPNVWTASSLSVYPSNQSAPYNPVINLKADVEVTGTGTSADPYVVQ